MSMHESTVYPFGNPRSYTVQLLTAGKVQIELLNAYQRSSLMQKLARQKHEDDPSLDYQYLLKIHSGQLLGGPGQFYVQYSRTIELTHDIEDKLNTIEFVAQELSAELAQVINIVVAGGENINIGRLHWRLLVDAEYLLANCRAILDLFARLTDSLNLQIRGFGMPERFAGQIKYARKPRRNSRDDTEYLDHISNLSWFDTLKEYRDELLHKTSLKITIEPVPDRRFPIYLKTKRGTVISFDTIFNIVNGVRDFASFYVAHSKKDLEDYVAS